jgi:hypothetical protein
VDGALVVAALDGLATGVFLLSLPNTTMATMTAAAPTTTATIEMVRSRGDIAG